MKPKNTTTNITNIDLHTSRMYDKAKTWNPFKGCNYTCSYCGPSYKTQAKRQMHNCMQCYNYVPHKHPDRLSHFPPSKIIFVCGNSDISFCDPEFVNEIIEAIIVRNKKRPDVTYYFQSKRPKFFEPFLDLFPPNVILLTTLETNRDKGYRTVSNAPLPSIRYEQFLNLNYPRKIVTIEPVMDFDLDVFTDWIFKIKPECVWLGYNGHPGSVNLPEPSEEKFLAFATKLITSGIEVREKDLRGIELPARGKGDK